MSDDEYELCSSHSDSVTYTYRYVEPDDVVTSKHHDDFHASPDIIQYNPTKAKAKTPEPDDGYYVYVPASKPRPRPVSPPVEDEVFVYVPKSKDVKRTVRRSYLPVRTRVATPKQEEARVWIRRPKGEDKDDNIYIFERNDSHGPASKNEKLAYSSSAPNVWLGRTKKEVTEDDARVARRYKMSSPPLVEGPPKYKADDMCWVRAKDGRLFPRTYATVRHLEGHWKQDNKDKWYFAMDETT